MIKFPTILTRRSVIGAGAGLAVAGTGRAVAHARLGPQADARSGRPRKPLKRQWLSIASRSATSRRTVISDGYGADTDQADPRNERL